MKLEYAHQQLSKQLFNTNDYLPLEGTIVVQMPTKEELEHVFLTHSNMTMLLTGLSIKSKNDRFIKKEGRKIAQTRLAPIVFELNEIQQKGTKHIYHLVTNRITINKKKFQVRIALSTVSESKDVRLINCSIDKVRKEITHD